MEQLLGGRRGGGRDQIGLLIGGFAFLADSAPRVAARSPSRAAGAAVLLALLVGCGAESAVEPSEREPGPVTGRDAELGREQEAALAALEAIGYAGGLDEVGSGPRGVTLHDSARAQAGLNLLVSGHAPEALLLDMDGKVLHRWSKPFEDVWPDREVKGKKPNRASFRRARLLPSGDLLAIFEGLGLVRLDKDSKLVWSYGENAHHDLDVDEAGRTLVLIREAGLRPGFHAEKPILEDFVATLGPDGSEQARVSVIECFERSQFAAELEGAPRSGDVFHTNSLEILDGSQVATHPAFAAGNVLLSMRRTGTLAVVDLERREVFWALHGAWRLQHDPVLLRSGRILLFDNKGLAHDASRVIEVDPRTGEIGWSYTSARFFSATCGTSRRLANGNTLISETERGRAFEVARDGTLVWEFESPYTVDWRDPDRALVAFVYEMVRLPADFPTDWL